MSETVLSARTPQAEALKLSVAEFLRGQAELADRTFNSITSKAHARTLRLLAEYVEALDAPNDQRLAALHVCQVHNRPPGTEAHVFAPGERVRRLIGSAGRVAGVVPSSEEILSELVRYSTEDLAASLTETHRLKQEHFRLDTRLHYLAKSEQAIERAQAQAAQAKERLSAVEADLATVKAEREFLRSLLPQEEPSEPEPEAVKPEPKAKAKAKPAKSRKRKQPTKPRPATGILTAKKLDRKGDPVDSPGARRSTGTQRGERGAQGIPGVPGSPGPEGDTGSTSA